MHTYLLLQLDSEGANFSQVADLLEDIGFRPHGAGYDFVYDWTRAATVAESLELADRIQTALHGSRVYFRIEASEE